jgi:hypothetical protein
MIKWSLTKQNLPNLISKLSELDFKKVWSVKITENKPIRSLSQNDRYWGMLQILGDYMGYAPTELHELMKYKFLSEEKEVAGQRITNVRSTSDLTTEEFVVFNDKVELFGNQYGCTFPKYELSQ